MQHPRRQYLTPTHFNKRISTRCRTLERYFAERPRRRFRGAFSADFQWKANAASRKEPPMRRNRCLLIVVAMLGSGCALQDARYDYSRLAAGLGDYDESIIDWNFPTSTNQGPLFPPERFG